MPNSETVKTASAHNYKKQIFVILLAIFIIFCLVFISLFYFNNKFTKNILIGNKNYSLEIVDNPASRQQGLGGRNNLAVNKAMLFDFKQNGRWSMWMKKMKFNLDFAWLDENGKVVYIKENVSPETFPSTFVSDNDARYVLELNSGSLQAADVKLGDIVHL